MILLALPILITLTLAILTFRMIRPKPLAFYLAAGAHLFIFGVALEIISRVRAEGIIVLAVGGWEPPFGITLVGDLFSACVLAVSSLISFFCHLYAPFSLKGRDRRLFLPATNVMLLGVYGAFLTGDLFNLYVWFEVMLLASFVLLSGGTKRARLAGAVKYVVLNVFSSMMFLSALGILFGEHGTLNMAQMGQKIAAGSGSEASIGGASLLIIAFSIKAALFPLYNWLPASYHHSPAVVSAILGALLTKVGVYSLFRVFSVIFPLPGSIFEDVLFWSSIFTMTFGVLGAAVQVNGRRILSFHIVSQVGYMTLGLSLATPLAWAASCFYLIHHIVAKCNLFLLAGIAEALSAGRASVKEQGGLFERVPLIAYCFLLSAGALAGVPPLSGFFAKLGVIIGTLEVDSYLALTVVLAVGVLTLYSMSKIWTESYWKEDPGLERKERRIPLNTYIAVVGMSVLSLLIGLNTGVIFDVCKEAADAIFYPEVYRNGVLQYSGESFP